MQKAQKSLLREDLKFVAIFVFYGLIIITMLSMLLYEKEISYLTSSKKKIYNSRDANEHFLKNCPRLCLRFFDFLRHDNNEQKSEIVN